MHQLHVYISIGNGIESIGSSSQQQRYIVTIYSTTHEPNPMNLDTVFYILPSEAAGARIQGEEKRIQLLQGGRELQSLIFHENHLFITVRIKLP